MKGAQKSPLSLVVRNFKSQNKFSHISCPCQSDQKSWATSQSILHMEHEQNEHLC